METQLQVTQWKVANDVARPELLAANTRLSYQQAWNALVAWCAANSIDNPYSLPGEQMADFLRHSYTARGLSHGTLLIYVSAVAWQYNQARIPPPTTDPEVRNALRLISRRSTARRRARPLTADILIEILQTMPGTLIGKRDAAILCVGFAAALRRSELVALNLQDITIDSANMMLRVRRSKTDQPGRGYDVPVIDGTRIRPITRLQAWIEAAALSQPDSPLFLTMHGGNRIHPHDVNRVVKQKVKRLGLDPDYYSAHSLRAGFVTSAARHGALIHKIMDVTRHTSTATVMQYVRDADKFSDHAAISFM